MQKQLRSIIVSRFRGSFPVSITGMVGLVSALCRRRQRRALPRGARGLSGERFLWIGGTTRGARWIGRVDGLRLWDERPIRTDSILVKTACRRAVTIFSLRPVWLLIALQKRIENAEPRESAPAVETALLEVTLLPIALLSGLARRVSPIFQGAIHLFHSLLPATLISTEGSPPFGEPAVNNTWRRFFSVILFDHVS
jgi:hypothetical protein